MRTSPLIVLIAVTSITLLTSNSLFAAAVQEIESADKDEKLLDGISTWAIDNEHTSVVCAASHFGLSFVYGRFNKCSGSIKMDFQEPSSSKFGFEIDADSIDTNNGSRDIELRGPNCLEVTKFKTITFESTSVKAQDKLISDGKTKRTFQVTGNLSMHGETREITLPMELLAMGNGPEGKLRCGFISRFVVSRSSFGLDGLKESVGDSIAVTFCFQAVRQQLEPKEEKASPFELEPKEEKASPFELVPKRDGDDVKKTERERLEELFRSKTTEPEDASEPVPNPFTKEDGSEDDG